MATAQEVTEMVIKPMSLACKPQTDPRANPESYAYMVNQYVESLLEYPPEVLRLGMRKWRDEWTVGVWPVVGKLRTYMNEAQREKGRANPAPRLPKPSRPSGPFVDPAWVSRWRKIFESGELGQWTKDEALHYCKTGERPALAAE